MVHLPYEVGLLDGKVVEGLDETYYFVGDVSKDLGAVLLVGEGDEL